MVTSTSPELQLPLVTADMKDGAFTVPPIKISQRVGKYPHFTSPHTSPHLTSPHPTPAMHYNFLNSCKIQVDAEGNMERQEKAESGIFIIFIFSIFCLFYYGEVRGER